jgi:3-hydroxyisobutyrate dehydrogenase-like beta-hydroxyacid dehydrogenase
MQVGFVGLGRQGGPMADMIGRAGFPLTVWARRPGVTDPFVAAGAVRADDLVDLGRRSDLVGVCVVNDDDVNDVASALLPGLRPGAVVVVHSTVHPQTVRRLAAAAADHRIDVLDAPVMGGGAAALRRRLAVAVGGDPALLDRCRPVLEAFGDPVVHVGPAGAGQQAKLLYNLLFVVNAGLHDRIASLGSELGLDRRGLGELLDQLRRSEFARRLVRREATPEALAHASRILTKDVTHALAVLQEEGLAAGPLGPLAWDAIDCLRRRPHDDGPELSS